MVVALEEFSEVDVARARLEMPLWVNVRHATKPT